MGLVIEHATEYVCDVEEYDSEADFIEQIAEYVGVLHAVALRLTHDPDRAENLVRQALATALDGRHTYSEDMHIKSWLLTILRNTFIKLDGALPGAEKCSTRDDGSLSYYLDLKQCSSLLASSTA